MKISILDQSVAHGYDGAAAALQSTIDMAQFAEQEGFERFWISEHHAFPSVAGTAPEVLLSAIGAATKTLRIGSGGIMLPHYSPYKVAEQFSLLANLYTDRIDLGIGRAPGSDMATATALARSGRPNFNDFGQQVAQLSEYLWDETAQPLVSPKPPKSLPIWMLGSSHDSAMLAAQRGLPYNLGAFINPSVDANVIDLYRKNYKPSELQPQPYSILSIVVFCAESEEYARLQQRATDMNFFRFITGQSGLNYLTPEETQDIPSSPQFDLFSRQRSGLRAVGTPQQVRAKIERITDRFQVDEIMAVTNMYHFEDRKTSFKLLREMFD